MKKLLLGCVLASVLTACGATEESEPNIVTDEDGHSAILKKGEESAYSQDSFSSENPNATPMGAGCWVVLDYCRDGNGNATCHDNGQCSYSQFVDACFALIRKLCQPS